MQETKTIFQPLDDESVLAQAWPDGAPASEIALWYALDEAGRNAAKARLSAMISYEQGGSWAGRDPNMFISRARFFAMLKAWRATRSLTSLVPAVLGRKGRGSGGSVDRIVRAMVSDLVRSEPGLTKEKIVQRVIVACKDGPSPTTLRHLVDKERATAARQALGGDAGFGRLVVIDSAPVFVRRKGEEKAVGAMVCMVIDQATSLVLGHTAGREGLEAIQLAVDNASVQLASMPIKVADHRQPRFEVGLRDSATTNLRETKRLLDLPEAIDVVHNRRERPVGTRLIEAFGPTIGKLNIRPRVDLPPTGSTVEDGSPGMTASEIVSELLDVQLAKHNAIILKRNVTAAVAPAVLTLALARIAYPSGGSRLGLGADDRS